MTFANDNTAPYTVRAEKTSEGLRYVARFQGEHVYSARTRSYAWFMVKEHKRTMITIEQELSSNRKGS